MALRRPISLRPSAMLNMDAPHDIRNPLLHRMSSDPMTPLSGVGSRTASVTHSELDEMWHHNLDSAVLSPHSDVSATGEFEFVPLRQHRLPDSPLSSTSTTAASVRSFLAEHRLAQLRAEHESERNRRRANVQAHADKFAALQARRRQMEEEQSAAMLAAAEDAAGSEPPSLQCHQKRRGSAFRTVIPTAEDPVNRRTSVDTGELNRRSGGDFDAGGRVGNRRPSDDVGSVRSLTNQQRSGSDHFDAGGRAADNRRSHHFDAEVNQHAAIQEAGRAGGCSSGDSGVAPPTAHFKALTGSSREGSDSGLDTTGVSETSAITFMPAVGVNASSAAVSNKSASIRMAGGASSAGGGSNDGQSRTGSASSIPTTTVMGVWCSRSTPKRAVVLSPPHGARSEVSSVDDEVLRYYEAATHSGLPPGLLLSPPPPPVPEEEAPTTAAARQRSDSENSSMSAASRRYEARIRGPARSLAVPALKIDTADNSADVPLSPRSPRTPRDAAFGAARSARHSEHVARLRASFEAPPEANRSSTHSLPVQGLSPRSSPSWRSAQPGLASHSSSMTSSAISARTLSPGRVEEPSRIATPIVRHQAPYRPSKDVLSAVAGASRPGPNAKFDSQFRSQAPPGPLTELEQLFESLDLDADLLHRAERREFTAYMQDRARTLDAARQTVQQPLLSRSLNFTTPLRPTAAPAFDSTSQLEDDVFDNSPHTPMTHSMVVSESSRTSSDHGSYMTPIATSELHREPPDSARSYRGPRTVPVPHMMPSPTSADYLLPRPERRKLEGFPDVRLDDMAWRKLQRDANSRGRVPEQPFVMRQRDFSSENDAGKRLGAFRTRRGMGKRSRSTERSPSPVNAHIIASDIPIDSSDFRNDSGGRYISSTILRFDHTGISTAPATTAFASNGLFRPIHAHTQAPVHRPPPPPRRHSGGVPLQSVDLTRPLVELGQVGVQTIVPRKFLLHKAASHDDIYIETETPFAFNISATDRDICISKVPSEEEMRKEKEELETNTWRPPPQLPSSMMVGSGGSSMIRRLSGGVPVTLRVVFGSDPTLSQRFCTNDNQLAACDSHSQSALSQAGRSAGMMTSSMQAGLPRHDSFRSVYHVDLGMA